MIYLAMPYTHVDPAVMEDRYQTGLDVIVRLMLSGEVVISPIAHSHPIAMRNPAIANEFEAWRELDETLILASDTVYVLTLEGWEDSYGVQQEVEFATARDIPVVYIDTNGDPVHVTVPAAWASWDHDTEDNDFWKED